MPSDDVRNDPGYQEWLKKHRVADNAPDVVDQIRVMNGGQPQLLQKPEGRINPSLMPNTKEMLSKLGNMANMGVGGAQIGGGVGGPLGALLGGAAGVGAGAFMPGSDTPGTDVGSLLGNLAASRIPGGGPLMRGITAGLGSGIGAYIGSMGDKKADFIKDTPWGKIALYSGVTAAGTAATEKLASSLAPSPTFTATQALKDTLGVEVPLGVGEAVQSSALQKLSRLTLNGTAAGKALAADQNKAEAEIIEKLVGKVIGKSASEIVDDSAAIQSKVYNAVNKIKPIPKVTDAEFAKSVSMTEAEATDFFKALRTAPDKFVNYFLPGRSSNPKGMLALRSFMQALPEQDRGTMASAVVARVLDNAKAVQHGTNGSYLSGTAFNDALFNKFGKDRLMIMLGKDRTEMLEQLGQIMMSADPAEKIGTNQTAIDAPLRYLSNKAVFQLFSTAAVGAAGGAASPSTVLGTLGGAAAGYALSVPIFVAVSRVMANPEIGKLLIAAGKHSNPKAAAAFMRSLTNPMTTEDKKAVEPSSTPATRYDGLFSR